ncbi:PSD1 and planctomycete cytochrome C domain-containing protein [Novipirellula herctigrandis]|uniref:PSD1 and planctomycete cytochrome C domain-containing protein n=1 Tax=Novipirellula herctigrandis TaxID=2527986 RepID=UPI003AF37DE7
MVKQLSIAIVIVVANALSSAFADEQAVNFNSDVRPILTRYCTSCHGGVKAISDVSFVNGASVLPPHGWVIQPGDAQASLMIERIVSDDPDMRMPPPEEHPDPVPTEDVDTLRRWINQGAIWDPIWSIGSLQPGTLDSVAQSDWAKQPLDRFVAARHRLDGIKPSDEAPPRQWLRRTAFDLTGLPPTKEQASRFVDQLQSFANNASDCEAAYADMVDELLASPAFGERWASLWMDLARYADSKGFEKDPHRDAWPYRDWLVDAFNADMPYDEFTVAQLAGDLWLQQNPDKVDSDVLIATAMHRNTLTNTEGGTDDEEYRIAAIIDRVNTTWTVWQGFTLGCVQCHSHPYDAIDHEEYYRVMSLFNNTLDCDLDNDFPTLVIPNGPAKVDAIDSQLQWIESRKQRNDLGVEVAEHARWQALTPEKAESTEGRLKIEGNEIVAAGGTFPVGVRYTLDYSTKLNAITALRTHLLPLSDDPTEWPEQGSVISMMKVFVKSEGGDSRTVTPQTVFVDAMTEPNNPEDALQGNAAGVGPYPKMHGPRWAVFAFDAPIELADGESIQLEIHQKQSTSGQISTPIRRMRCEVSDDVKWCERLASDQYKDAVAKLAETSKNAKLIQGGKLPVVASRPLRQSRETREFIRGNWLDKGGVVPPGVPKLFSASGDPPSIVNRLELAEWLVSDDNALTARVWANRIWEQLFGIGIVETLEDFGSSGASPSHAELLEHLAIRLKATHRWHLKPLLREIVLSATYRQDNRADESLYENDRANRSLARGPRTRLTAEMVRDQALAASGLLNRSMGGPSVMPPQPDGLWQTVYSSQKWKTSAGDEKYRRAIYTYWKRTSPYPSFLTFDAPTREGCSPRRTVTNTPLQALVTLNDPVFVECGEALARSAIEHHASQKDRAESIDSPDVEAVIATMVENVTQQPVSETDASELRSLYDQLCGNDKTGIDFDAMAIIGNTLLNWERALTK